MDCPRDLAQVDPWQESLERSLARRGRSKRSSVELHRLRGDRDLLLGDVVLESAQYSQLRRRAADHPLVPRPAAALTGVSALTILAVMAMRGSLAKAGGINQRVPYAAKVRGRGRAERSAAIASPRTPSAADRVLAGESTLADFEPAASNVLSISESVQQLQGRLGVVADGDFGPITLRAVKGFQASHGLIVDGIVGPATRAALGLPAGPILRANPIYFPHSGRHESVQQLQSRLGVAADGDFGPITLRAVRDFQASHRLVVDGIVGPATRAALGLPVGPMLRANPIYFPSAPPTASGYVNPLAQASVTPERIDMGVDYAGTGSLTALGEGTVTFVGTSATGWPGAFVEYRLMDGPDAGRYVYYAEGVRPVVSVGQVVTAGQTVAYLIPGWPSGIELGWGSGLGTSTLAQELGEDSFPTAAGETFSALIASLEGPAGIP